MKTPERHRLPATRRAIVHKFTIGGTEGYAIVGLYENGTPGELFLHISKEGSTLSGAMDCFAILVSLALQSGLPLKTLVEKFRHVRFSPDGFTANRNIPTASSIIDYLFHWLDLQFLSRGKRAA